MSLRIFIGMDERQPIAYNVAAYSMASASSYPVAITPLILSQLPIDRRGLTDFTFARYLVPFLCNYQGMALFADPDTLTRGDVSKIMSFNDNAVSVVPHTSVMKENEIVSTMFERNAVMLFNCAKCTKLTPDWIDDPANAPNKLSSWADTIGELPREWNHLVGYDAPNPAAQLVHFTMGIPCFPETKNDEFADEWREAHRAMNGTVPWKDIMGTSVHARWKR
jgi:hypothetical protein